MSAQVIDFPMIPRLNVHHPVVRKVELENIVDQKICKLCAKAGVTVDQFIWGCVIQSLAEMEGISAQNFVRKYLE